MLELTTSNIGEMAINYRQAPTLYAANVIPTMRRVGLMLLRAVRDEKLQGQVLNARTRRLTRATFTNTVADASAHEVVTRVGVDLKKAVHGRAQELGAEIRPVRAKNLAIPVGRALTASGVARMSAREFMSNPAALGFESAWVYRGVTGAPVIMGRRARGLAEVVYVLKSRVTLPPRSHLASTAREKRDRVIAMLRGGVGEFVQAVRRG